MGRIGRRSTATARGRPPPELDLQLPHLLWNGITVTVLPFSMSSTLVATRRFRARPGSAPRSPRTPDQSAGKARLQGRSEAAVLKRRSPHDPPRRSGGACCELPRDRL